MSILDIAKKHIKTEREKKAEKESQKDLMPPPAEWKPPSFSSNRYIRALQDFLESPFKDDRKFALHYLANLTRDRIHECEPLLDKLFYRYIFGFIVGPKGADEGNRHRAFDIMCNMIQSEKQRARLGQEDCLGRVFEKLASTSDSKDAQDLNILKKLSWLATLISFHKDMYHHIKRIGLLQFVIKISGTQFPSQVRSNAVLAISLLTYNENLFDEIINEGVIELVMALCRDKDQEIHVKQYSTLALVHFALNRRSIKILIERGVLNLFDTFSSGSKEQSEAVSDGAAASDMIIQTNVAWIFLALCTNDITGKQMLQQGITRDMFLVSCNPNFHQIRHLVITGFAELGRCNDNQEKDTNEYPAEAQRIKETAIVGMHSHFVKDAQKNVDILIAFSTSASVAHQFTAFWALKDYILLTHDNLIKNI